MPTFSRRQLLERTCLGFGNLVLADLLNGAATYNDLKPRRKHLPGQPLPGGVEIHQLNNVNTLLPCPFEFRKHG